jgi:hypothetical protein
MNAMQPAAYDELVDLFADTAVAERILAFHPSPAMQARIEELLEKNRRGKLTAEEKTELDEVERLEHLMRLIKARVRQKLVG